jgi:SAP domain-containing ribonucleoprotein
MFNWPQAPPPKKAVPPSASTPASVATCAGGPVAESSTVADEELEKRKKRAERFGIPLAEAPKPRPSPTKRASGVTQNATTLTTSVDVCSC